MKLRVSDGSPAHVIDPVVAEQGETRKVTGIVREERIVIPGHFDRVERRVLVSDGHFECVERQELLAPGHYQTRVERVERPWRAERQRGDGFGPSWRD